jgi:hypothetical protein
MSPVLRLCSLSPVLCPLSHVSVPCLPSAVPSLMSLFLVSCPLSSVSRLCSLSLVLCTLSLSHVLCTLSHVICSLSPILLSPSHNQYQQSQCLLLCGSLPLFLSFTPLFPVLCSSISCPLFLVFYIARMRVFLKNTHAYTCNRRF